MCILYSVQFIGAASADVVVIDERQIIIERKYTTIKYVGWKVLVRNISIKSIKFHFFNL